MAENATDYLICVKRQDIEHLGGLRQWENLFLAFEENIIWLKGFSPSQINSTLVKSIPFVERFYEKKGKLFPYHSTLPKGNLPSLLWTPIRRALRVTLPSFNHNYFGISEKISIKLVASQRERQAIAMQISLKDLEIYMSQAPEIRLKNLTWIIINQKEALLLGRPLLPLQGKVFWQNNDFLIPAGYDFDLFALSEVLNHKINPDNKNYVIWQGNSEFFYLPKSNFKALTLASFRLSIQKLNMN